MANAGVVNSDQAMDAALARHAKRIGIEDGTSHTALREWLDVITPAKEWTRANDEQTIKMVRYLIKGDLDRASISEARLSQVLPGMALNSIFTSIFLTPMSPNGSVNRLTVSVRLITRMCVIMRSFSTKR